MNSSRSYRVVVCMVIDDCSRFLVRPEGYMILSIHCIVVLGVVCSGVDVSGVSDVSRECGSTLLAVVAW
jgi:hypothetical protein